MRLCLKSAGIVILGVLTAAAIFMIGEVINSRLYPLPPGTDPTNAASIGQAMAALPNRAFVLLIVGWMLGSLVGAWSAARMASRGPAAHGGIVTGLLIVAGVLNMLGLPHPVWVWIAGIAGFVAGGSTGSFHGTRRRAA